MQISYRITKYCVYKMRMFNHSLHFIETKAGHWRRGFKPNFLVTGVVPLASPNMETARYLVLSSRNTSVACNNRRIRIRSRVNSETAGWRTRLEIDCRYPRHIGEFPLSGNWCAPKGQHNSVGWIGNHSKNCCSHDYDWQFLYRIHEINCSQNGIFTVANLNELLPNLTYLEIPATDLVRHRCISIG